MWGVVDGEMEIIDQHSQHKYGSKLTTCLPPTLNLFHRNKQLAKRIGRPDLYKFYIYSMWTRW